MRDLVEHFTRREVHEPLHEVEPRAAHAGIVHVLQLRVGDAAIDGGDAARSVVRRTQRVHERPIVGAVAGGLHDHVLVEAETVAQREELFLRGVARRVFPLGRVRELRRRVRTRGSARPPHPGGTLNAGDGRIRMERQPAGRDVIRHESEEVEYGDQIRFLSIDLGLDRLGVVARAPDTVLGLIEPRPVDAACRSDERDRLRHRRSLRGDRVAWCPGIATMCVPCARTQARATWRHRAAALRASAASPSSSCRFCGK